MVYQSIHVPSKSLTINNYNSDKCVIKKFQDWKQVLRYYQNVKNCGFEWLLCFHIKEIDTYVLSYLSWVNCDEVKVLFRGPDLIKTTMGSLVLIQTVFVL